MKRSGHYSRWILLYNREMMTSQFLDWHHLRNPRAWLTPAWRCAIRLACAGLDSYIRDNIWRNCKVCEEIVKGTKYDARMVAPYPPGYDIGSPQTSPSCSFDQNEYFKPACEAAELIVQARFEAFGCAGQAGKIKPIPLDKIAAKYKSGELAPKVN